MLRGYFSRLKINFVFNHFYFTVSRTKKKKKRLSWFVEDLLQCYLRLLCNILGLNLMLCVTKKSLRCSLSASKIGMSDLNRRWEALVGCVLLFGLVISVAIFFLSYCLLKEGYGQHLCSSILLAYHLEASTMWFSI